MSSKARVRSRDLVREQVRIHAVVPLVYSASLDGVNQIAITPDPSSLGLYSPKLAQLSDVFTLFRVRSLRVTPNGVVQCPAGGYSGTLTLGYNPEITSAAQTYDDIVNMPFSTYPIRFISNSDSGPPVNLQYDHSPTDLKTYQVPVHTTNATMTQWFRTRVGGFDDNLEMQGLLYIGCRLLGAVSVTLYAHLVIDVDIEFKEFCPAGATPKRVGPLRDRDSSEQKRELVSQNSGSSSVGGGQINSPAVQNDGSDALRLGPAIRAFLRQSGVCPPGGAGWVKVLDEDIK